MSEAEKPTAPTVITVDPKTQMLVAKDNSDLIRLIRQFMKGAAFPKTLDTEEKIIAAWQTAASLGLPPMVAIQNLAVIHGSVAMWGQLPKALAEKTGQMEEYKLILFDPAQKVISLENKNLDAPVWGAATQMRRSKRSMNEYVFTEIDAKAAGLFNKPGPWISYKKVMYARRSTGQATKFEFPDALMGVPIAEYDFHEAPDLVDITPRRPRSDAANQLWEEMNGTAVQTNDPLEGSKDVSGPTGHQD